MEDATCAWAGCKNGPEAVLANRAVCRIHFHQLAAKRLEMIRARFAETGPVSPQNAHDARFLSELIGGVTELVATAKDLSESQRNDYLDLSLSAIALYSRLQRHPRFQKELAVVLRRSSDPRSWGEFTKTLNVSKKGSCIEAGSEWRVSEEIWIERADNRTQTRARIIWVKKQQSSRYLLGVEILNCLDFWTLD